MDFVTVGVDVGQKHDPTAIVVAQAIERETGRKRETARFPDGSFNLEPETETVYLVRHIERLALGTSYPDVAARVSVVGANLEALLGDASLQMVVDATGVGTPVVDIIRRTMAGTRFHVTAATFTGTERIDGGSWSSDVRVGKAWLVSRLQALLQTGRIKLPETPDARALAEEMADYELRVTEHANLAAGAFRTGAHDDLVTALGLAVMFDPMEQRAWLGPRLWG